MLLTKKGLKIWGSGMIVLIMTFLFSLLMTEEYLNAMSLWELLFIGLLLLPLALGVAQNWYWTRGDSDDEPVEL